MNQLWGQIRSQWWRRTRQAGKKQLNKPQTGKNKINLEKDHTHTHTHSHIHAHTQLEKISHFEAQIITATVLCDIFVPITQLLQKNLTLIYHTEFHNTKTKHQICNRLLLLNWIWSQWKILKRNNIRNYKNCMLFQKYVLCVITYTYTR